MYMLPLVSGLVEYLSGKPRPHCTLLGLIAPTAVRFFFSTRFFFPIDCFFVSVGIGDGERFRDAMAME